MQGTGQSIDPAIGTAIDTSGEPGSLNHLFDRTIAALSVADAGKLAEVLNQCSRVALPGPGREWGLAMEKRRILAALLRETGRNLRLLHGASPAESYTRRIGQTSTGSIRNR